MNDRQQRAQAHIMALIAALPWTERPSVFRAIAKNDDLCPHCGTVTVRYGECEHFRPAIYEVIDAAGWAEAAFSDDVAPSHREQGN